MYCFNTQPPEGGWATSSLRRSKPLLFQHTAARRRLEELTKWIGDINEFQHTAARRRLGYYVRLYLHALHVSTHSRPKAAGLKALFLLMMTFQFQHTAARRRLGSAFNLNDNATNVSTHSRPKAAGISISLTDKRGFVSTHSRPKAAGY